MLSASFRASAALALLAVLMRSCAESAKPPHIFFVIVDDFGWGNVGYHRAEEEHPEVATPTLDALAKSGVELNRHYVHMMCTPSRASFQTGRLPIHVITQLSDPCDGNGAILDMTGIASQLKKAHYRTIK